MRLAAPRGRPGLLPEHAAGGVLAADGILRPDGQHRLGELAFALRTASACKVSGGSIAAMQSSWNMWFGTMSRSAPVGS